MGKSSSSRKKERSKSSSSLKSRRKSRNRKLKSKKLRRRHDSPSYSENGSEISTSVFSSSSDDDSKVRRSRSGTRKDAKTRKKRAQKRSHDRQTRGSSPHPRKRKNSKRDNDSKVKRTYKKKRRRRDVSVGARSSDSLSCSTCREGSNGSSESEIDRHRGRSQKRKRNLGKTERSRYRSRSHSSCSLRSKDSEYQIEVEDDSFVDNSRRLKSIIVVAGVQYESKSFSEDEEQEEFTNHPDDNHPFFRNMDGNREVDFVSSKEVSKVANEEEALVPDIRNFIGIKDHELQNKGSNDKHGGESNETNDCSRNSDGTNGVDLESILRQRALENLRRFKGAPQKDVEAPANRNEDKNNDPEQLDPPVSKSVHPKLPRDDAKVNGMEFSRPDCGNVVVSMAKENGSKSTGTIDLAVSNMLDFDHSSENLGKSSDENNDSSKLQQDYTSLNQEVINDDNGQKADAVICSTTNRRNLVIAASRPQSKVDSPIKQEHASQESMQTKPSISNMSVNEAAQILTRTANNDDQNTGNGNGSSDAKPSSSLKSISGESNLIKPGHEKEEGSQFEQKTMSVMRGGEMVQVNYKVYIPKKAPALARRQLKR